MSPIQMLDAVGENAPLEPELTEAFTRVLRSGRYILGEEVERFEARCAEYLGVRHAIGVSSGTDGLLLALMALGIGEGDEVLCPAFTFFATAGCIARTGARPIFVDADEMTFNIDVNDAARRVTKRTKAIMPVHLFGQAADMDAVTSLAEQHGLFVIEDAAQAFGSKYRGRSVGSIGDVAAFSFYPTKNLGAFGDAGLVVTGDDDLADRTRCLRVHGGRRRYYHDHIGGNFRLDSLQAALLTAKLAHLDEYTARRRANARAYSTLLRPVAEERPDLRLPYTSEESVHVWNQYTLRVRSMEVPSGTTAPRDSLRDCLAAHGIASEVYYPVPLHKQKCFADANSDSLPVSEQFANEVLSLPVHPTVTLGQCERVADRVKEFMAVRPAEIRSL